MKLMLHIAMAVIHIVLTLFWSLLAPLVVAVLHILAMSFGGGKAGALDACSIANLKFLKYAEDTLSYLFKIGKWEEPH